MKRCLMLLLALVTGVSFCFAAQAAPARDMQAIQVEIDPGMRLLTETVLGAAVFTDIRGLEENLGPAPALAEAALSLGLYNLSLPSAGENAQAGGARLPMPTARALYDTLFASGDFAHAEAAPVSGVTVEGDEVAFDLSVWQEYPMIGAYIYSAALSGDESDPAGEGAELKADLYTYYGDFGTDAQDLPEDGLTWLCNAEISLQRAPETAYGWRVKGFALSDDYEDGALSDWQAVENEQAEYSVNMPATMGLAADDPMHLLWQTADGSASIRIDVEALAGRDAHQALSAFRAEHEGREIVEQPEFSVYYSLGEGDYQLWIIETGMDSLYHLSMQFPPQRQAEYALYSEFIRNSMIVWGISNG